MSKPRLHINDDIFAHAKTSSWHNESDLFDWDRTVSTDVMVFTDNLLRNAENSEAKHKYAWLVESPAITPESRVYVTNNEHLFDGIFTFDKSLYEKSSKYHFTPCGGCWVLEQDRAVHTKSKNVSMIMSHKMTTEGHRLRHEIAGRNDGIDIFGYTNPIDNKITGLKDYRFSVSVENTRADYYFTEKLIDCFMTGTVPVYWGCPSIGDFFNTDGVVVIDSADDLQAVLGELTEDRYQSMLDAVNENFELAKEYLVCDDFVYRKIKELTCVK